MTIVSNAARAPAPTRFLVLACVMGLSTGIAHAQVAIEVTLVDEAAQRPAGPGIAVVLENPATGQTLMSQSDSRGRARFGGLGTGGVWRVSVPETDQYRSAETGEISLRSVVDRGISLSLSPNTDGIEEIEVVGSRAISRLNVVNAEVSGTLDIAEIERIPVEARSLERVLFRLPGVTQATGFFGEAPSVAINGSNGLFTNYTIDGLDNNENFLGGQRFPVPVGAISEVTVLAGSYSVEYGRTTNGIVNVTTKSGTNDFHGEAYFLTRPGGFLSAEPDIGAATTLFGAPITDNFRRFQGGFGIGGPIARGRTFFFLNAEFTRDGTENVLSSPLLPEAALIGGSNRQTLLTARLDHNWTNLLRSSLRINHGRVNLERQGGGLTGGLTFPSAGSVQDRISTNVALTTTYARGALDYTISFNYSRFDWDFGEPLVPAGPQVAVFGPNGLSTGTIGSPGFIFDETENTGQIQQKLTLQSGRHQFKLGSDFINARLGLFGGGNVDGNFSVTLTQAQIDLIRASGVGTGFGVADIPADAQLNSAFFETQPNSFGETQRIYSFYAEDQFQVLPELSLTLGLRYDFDNLTNLVGNGDFNNIGPRLAANWVPATNVSVRAGIGLFYEKIPYAIISDAIQQNSTAPAFLGQLRQLQAAGIIPGDIDPARLVTDRGNISVDATSLCSAVFRCPAISELAGLRNQVTFNGDRRIFNPFGLDNPEALQASLGVQWQPSRLWVLGIDGQFHRNRNVLRLVDLNAAAPFVFEGTPRNVAAANATRPAVNPDGTIPTGGARSIIISDTGGRSRYQALIFSARKEKGEDRYDANLFYTLSRLVNDSDDINVRANDANNFAADIGPSLNDRTHVISTIFNLYPLEGLTFTLAGLFQSGQPVNFIPDASLTGTTDLNGDGLSFADQFTGNPDRAPGFARNSGRLPWSTNVDIGFGYRLGTPGPGRSGGLEIRADFFNIFNVNNESGFPVSFTASNQIQIAGRPFTQRSAAPPRTFQLQARYSF